MENLETAPRRSSQGQLALHNHPKLSVPQSQGHGNPGTAVCPHTPAEGTYIHVPSTLTSLQNLPVLKNWCFQIVVLEKTPESPLDSKEIKPVNPKGSQSWIFTGRTDAEAAVLWPPDMNSQLTGKHPDAGKDWGQEEKGVTEDEMVGWHHQLNGNEFEQTGRQWRTGKPGVLQSMGSQKAEHDLVTKQQLAFLSSLFQAQILTIINVNLKYPSRWRGVETWSQLLAHSARMSLQHFSIISQHQQGSCGHGVGGGAIWFLKGRQQVLKTMSRFGSSHCLPLLSSFSDPVSVPLAPSLTPAPTFAPTDSKHIDELIFLCKVMSSSMCCCCSVTKLCPTLCDPWTAARQACLSFTISWSLPKFTSIESVEEGMANHSSILAMRTPSLYCMLYKDFRSKMDLRVLIARLNHLALLQGEPVHSSVRNVITLSGHICSFSGCGTYRAHTE